MIKILLKFYVRNDFFHFFHSIVLLHANFYKYNQVISRSTLDCQIKIVDILSKNLPPPLHSFNGGHDFENLFNHALNLHLVPCLIKCNNFLDFM